MHIYVVCSLEVGTPHSMTMKMTLIGKWSKRKWPWYEVSKNSSVFWSFYFWSCSLKYLSLRIFWSFSFFHFYRNLYHGHFPLYHGQLPFVHFPIKVIFWSSPHSCFLKLRNEHFKLIQFLWSELRLNLFLAIVESTL